jgi:RHS repeat-associated protein
VNSSTGTYNADDELASETYDNNGNTLTTGGKTFTYDAENHLTGMTSGSTTVSIVYDAFGNRVAKTVNGVTTKYLVEDDVNPTRLPQVMEEIVGGAVTRTYTYGLQRISEDQIISGTWTPSFYGYDGASSVRQLTNVAGAVTDTYEFDAFGNKVSSTGTTSNNYLYRGEQYDPDLSLYYLRARYYNQSTGRFLNVDPLAGDGQRRYEYAAADPVDGMDPSGNQVLVEYRPLIPTAVNWRPNWCLQTLNSPMAAYLPGCSGPPPSPPPPCTGPGCKPTCFAQLKYRPAPAGKTHAFWFVQDRNSQWFVIDGGPAWPYPPFGYLVDWITPGIVSSQYAADNAETSGTWFDSGVSCQVCSRVDQLESAAREWPPVPSGIWYRPVFGPNSNSFARYIGEQGDFHPTRPPGSQAWDTPIPTFSGSQ